MDDIQSESTGSLWDRSQPWRQGSILSREDAFSLGLEADFVSETTIGVVASHDCDCVSSVKADPAIEIVLANIIEPGKQDGNYHNGKNVRILHLPISDTGQVLELRSSPKLQIPKVRLVKLAPNSEIRLCPKEKEILSRWLAARYSRGSFPDSLMDRLERIKSDLEAAGKIDPDSVLGIYIDYDPHAEIKDPNEPYSLFIAVVYKSEVQDAGLAAERVVKKIKDSFEKRYKTVETAQFGILWRDIELQFCEAISDDVFSLRDTLTYVLYRLEHISLKQNPPTEIPVQF